MQRRAGRHSAIFSCVQGWQLTVATSILAADSLGISQIKLTRPSPAPGMRL